MSLALLALPAAASNDPDFSRQYGPQQLNAPAAWTKTRGAGVTIAVVDSGVDGEHPDLRAKVVRGYDFGDDDTNADDDSDTRDAAGKAVRGHGTSVAGVAGAATDNGIGIAGVAPDARIMPLKVFGRSGIVGITNVPRAIRFAVDNGARVINLSLGTFSTGIDFVGLIDTPCAEALQRGALCVVASGNGGANRSSGYSRGFPGLMVTANDREGRHASFGQRADTQWSASAAGVAVYTTTTMEQGGYGAVSGTSFAAPHAAGVAALVYAELKPPPTPAGAQAVVDRLLSSARPLGDPGTSGAGLLDAAGAVGANPQAAATTVPPPPPRSSATARAGSPGAPAARPRTSPDAAAPATTARSPVTPVPAPPVVSAPPVTPPPVVSDTLAPEEGLALADEQALPVDSSPEGVKPTLYTIAGVLVLATGWWARTARSRLQRPMPTKTSTLAAPHHP